MAGYYHYFSFGLSAYIDKLLVRVREEVYQVFSTALEPQPSDRILDVGVSADDHISSNHFEKRYPYTARVCALGVEHLPQLTNQFPGLTVVQGDARALPFADNSFDFVYSHAVIEHVGHRDQQAQFVNEAVRVARKGVLLTTPNRWHPLEAHTGLPLLHYLPPFIFRPVYRMLGKSMYATEDNLNLMSNRQMGLMLKRPQKPAGQFTSRFYGVNWLGVTSNLILVIRKTSN